MEIIPAKKENLKKIVGFLEKGKVLVCPTDTVYGLLCDAANEKAVGKIFKIKKREKLKPLPVFVKNIAAAKKFAYINRRQEQFLKNNKVTAILKAKKKNLSRLIYKDDTIGIRVPNYEFLNLILEKFKNPLAQTSANISGRPATIKMKDVLEQFERSIIQPDLIVDAGNLSKNKPSKVIDFTGKQIRTLRY